MPNGSIDIEIGNHRIQEMLANEWESSLADSVASPIFHVAEPFVFDEHRPPGFKCLV
jgi:hypothetical protein